VTGSKNFFQVIARNAAGDSAPSSVVRCNGNGNGNGK
jgi:hypothetical protein